MGVVAMKDVSGSQVDTPAAAKAQLPGRARGTGNRRPDSLVSDFSSLTTPFCWVITEDSVAVCDGAAPLAVGKSRSGHAVIWALNAGRFSRLADGKDRGRVIGGRTT